MIRDSTHGGRERLRTKDTRKDDVGSLASITFEVRGLESNAFKLYHSSQHEIEEYEEKGDKELDRWKEWKSNYRKKSVIMKKRILRKKKEV